MLASLGQNPALIHYLPILTTLVGAAFFIVLVQAHRERRSGPHLIWWAAGVFFYGLGTAIEGSITLWGNTVVMNKAWYIAGALLGGYPLAQGSVYLLYSRRTAHWLTAITIPVIVLASVFVILSPVDLSVMEAHRPTGAILEWRWVRLMTPFINLYAFVFLVGGAFVSAIRYKKRGGDVRGVYGNVLIAVGGLLPGVGGTMAKAGMVEALYVGEFVGLILIWVGYASMAKRHVRVPVPVT